MSRSRRGVLAGAVCAAGLVAGLTSRLWAGVVTLENTLQYEGAVGKIAALGEDPDRPKPAVNVPVKSILLIDDEIRRIYLRARLMRTFSEADSRRNPVRVPVQKNVCQGPLRLKAVGRLIDISAWDALGNRVVTYEGPKGPVDVIQGITEITPQYTTVEALHVKNGVMWKMRIATSSIPRDVLSQVLARHLNQEDANERLQIVSLYMESDRYQDAENELQDVIDDFPLLKDLEKQRNLIRQQKANQILRELDRRREAGQHEWARYLLNNFDEKDIAGEIQIRVKEELGEYSRAIEQYQQVLKQLDTHLAAVENEDTRRKLGPILQEIKTELHAVNTLDRMADYLRLADDKALRADQKLALAISGWLLGSGQGVENLGIALPLFDVRNLVREYLRTGKHDRQRREDLLAQLEQLEGSSPKYLALLVDHMLPPIETPPTAARRARKSRRATEPGQPADAASVEAPPTDVPAGEAPPADVPRVAPPPGAVLPGNAGNQGAEPAADPDEVPGFFELSVAGLPNEPDVTYLVQLPPEYDPHRRYPCIVALSGGGRNPEQELEWWAGPYEPKRKMRQGQATREGYIVLSPVWTIPHQRKYEYTPREHAAVLNSLRDACKRFAIDTDRVFLSGHSMGGDAAWDIGLAHPDLWAGVIPFVATADKYIKFYWENGRRLPMYFVGGDMDGNVLALNKDEWNRYLTHNDFDTTVVLFQGRGHEDFADEILRVFDWMRVHTRSFFQEKFECRSMRPWDNFFWWAEVDDLPEQAIVVPANWSARSGRPAVTEGEIVRATNRVRLSPAGKKATVWLSPEMVDLDKAVVKINSREFKNIRASAAVLLEDVRTRGDRRHPFWARVSNTD